MDNFKEGLKQSESEIIDAMSDITDLIKRYPFMFPAPPDDPVLDAKVVGDEEEERNGNRES